MKSKKVILIIIPICLALVAAIVLSISVITGVFLSPKARVMLALSRTFGANSIISEYSGNKSVSEYGYAPEYLADLLKASDMLETMKERGYSVEASYSLSELDASGLLTTGSFSNIGMKVAGDVDTINRVAYYDLTMQYNFLKISLGKYYLTDRAISMAMPSYFDGYLTLPTDTFGTSYNASIFPSALGKIPQELESSVSFSAYDLFCPSTPDKDSFMAAEDTLSILKDFYDNMEVDKTGRTRSILIGTKQQECDEYRITLAEEDVLSLFEAYEDWYFSANRETIENYNIYYTYLCSLDSSFADFPSSYEDLLRDIFDGYKELIAVDHEIYVYLDNKDRLAAASYEVELDTGSLQGLLGDDSAEMELLDEIRDFDLDDLYDDLLGYLYYGGSIGNYPTVDNDSADDSTDDSDFPKTCTISAEIVFHGRDYLPERYEGSFLIALDNGYSFEANYTGENRTDNNDIYHSILNAALNLEGDGDSYSFDIAYEASYQTDDKDLTVELTVTDEDRKDLLNIVSDSTLSLENDTIEFDLEELTLTVGSGVNESGVTIDAEVSFSPLTDRVPLPEGKERNLFTMSTQDYEMFFDEITDGLLNLLLWI